MAAVEERLSVEVGVLRNAVHFEQKLTDFRLQICAIARAVDVRRRFDRENADALQNVGLLGQRAERDLRSVISVLHVLRRLIERLVLRGKVGCDRVTRGVIRSGVDPQTG